MAIEVIMPKLGATMEEGVIDSWLVKIGEFVEEGDPIAEIQTDKIVLEVEAELSGYLLQTLYNVGDTVKVHEIIAYMGEEGESLPEGNEVVVENPGLAVIEDATTAIRKTPAANKLAKDQGIALSAVQGTGPKGRVHKKDVEVYLESQSVKITPLARKITETLNIDANELTGSGHNGKITKTDVLDSVVPTQQSVESTVSHNVKKKPFKGIRKVIAERMAESYYSAPHVTLSVEINMAQSVLLRTQLLPLIEKQTGYRLSYNDLIIKAVAQAMKHNKSLNVSLQGDEIYQYEEVNIGFAVALDDGLVVPVIKQVDQLSLSDIVMASKEVVTNIKNGKLNPAYFEAGTFTISNLGMYAVDTFTPIINQPQSAILGVGRIVEKPVVKNKEVMIEPTMHLSLSFDHRIIDGAPAAQFLTDLKELLENPMKMLA